MTEQQESSNEIPEEQVSGSEVLEELHALGLQMAAAVKTMWDSDESRQLRQEIGDGFVELGQQIDSAVKTTQESETAKQFSEQVKEAVDRARASDVTQKFEEGLVAGLHELNVQLSKAISSMEPSETAQKETEGETAEEETASETEA